MGQPKQQYPSGRPADAAGAESKRLSYEADQLQASLDEVARAHGYLSYSHMQQRVTADIEALDEDFRKSLLKKLLPLSSSPTGVPAGPLPADLAGFTPEPDVVKSLARLIRVLLLGYTEEELLELSDRIKAVRVQELEASAPEREGRHREVIGWIDRADPSSPRKVSR